jgi:hypothetical protein
LTCSVKTDDFSGKAFVLNKEAGIYNSPYLADSAVTTILFMDSMKCITVSQKFSVDFISPGTYTVLEDKIRLNLDTFQVSYSSGYRENGPVISAVTIPTVTIQNTGKRTIEFKLFKHQKEILLVPSNEIPLFDKPEAYESTMAWLEGQEILTLLRNPKFKSHWQNMIENP